MRECTEEMFMRDVPTHQLSVLKDDGVYRHLQFRNPKTSCMWFDLITWPGCLAVRGDMGTYVFSRLPDMFEFFRGDRDINPGYWGEKLIASEGDGSHPNFKRFSFDLFKKHVDETVASWIDDYELSVGQARTLKLEVDEMLDSFDWEDDRGAYAAVVHFRSCTGGHNFYFSDSWEWNCQDYTYHFLWCCYAIKWGIQQYDAVHFMDKGAA